MVWLAVLAFVFNVNLAKRSLGGNVLDILVVLIIVLFFEPLLLRLFGTTLGKAIFGLRIEALNGGRPSYEEGLYRTFGVIRYGLGFSIPIYNLYRLWKSYSACSNKETLPWDEELSYTLKDAKNYRIVIYIGAIAAAIVALVMVVSAQFLPPNRGELTVSEFVENHNYYAKLIGYEFGSEYLDKNGEWAEKEYDSSYYIDTSYEVRPEYQFEIKNGYITSVSFIIEVTDNKEWVSTFDSYMLLVSLALTGAQQEVGLFSKTPNSIAEQIYANAFKDYSFEEAGVTTTCDVEYSGYNDASYYLLPDENTNDNYFRLEFSVSK